MTVVAPTRPPSRSWRPATRRSATSGAATATNIPGATSASYTLTPTAVSDTGAQFAVVVTNAAGTATSAAATLTVEPAPTPPSITTPPANVTVTAPAPAAFSVVAAGDAPLSYQWRRNGVEHPRRHQRVLHAHADRRQRLRRAVQRRRDQRLGTATSAAATLTVLPGATPHFSYFGSFARYPTTDNGSSGSATTSAIAPPAGMSTGQLAWSSRRIATTGNKGQSVTVSATGGQTWQRAGVSQRVRQALRPRVLDAVQRHLAASSPRSR